MEGKNLLIVIALLIEVVVAYHSHNRIHHQDNACHNPMLTKAIHLLQTDTNNIKQNLRCRMDPVACSDIILRTNNEDNTYFEYGDVCNRRFLNNFRTILRVFYMDMTRIREYITALQSDLILYQDDPLLPITNKLINGIRNVLEASQPNVTFSLPLSCIYTNDVSGESGMLMDLLQITNNFGNFISTALQTLEA